MRAQALGPVAVVHVLADPVLGALYCSALTVAGADPVLLDSHAAFVTGITAIWRFADAP